MKRRIIPALLAATLVVTAAVVTPVTHAEKADFVRAESFRLLNAGVAAVNRGDYAEAIENLEKCAGWALTSFRAHYYLGLALMGDRRYDDAIEIFGLALDLDPTHLQAHISLGNSYLLMGDTGEALAEFYRSLKLRPEFPAGLDGVARVYEATGEIERSIGYFMRAIESNRGYAEAYTNLGDLYLRENRLDEAVRLLEEAIDIRPDFAPGLNRLALGYARLGLHNEAVATIERAIELQPGAPVHRATLGQIELEMTLISSAEESFNEALEIDEYLPDAREGMAEVHRYRGEWEEAVAQLNKALADKHLPARIRQQIEDHRTEIEREAVRAEELLARVESGEATHEDYRALAGLYADRRLWSKAAELQAASEPTGVERERLAFMLFEGGQFREAQRIYSEMATETRRADLAVNNGVALSQLGDDPGAVAAYRRALELSSEMLLARLYLGNALLRLGDTDGAVAAYRDFLLGGGGGESAERVRRILLVIAPEAIPEKDDDDDDLLPPPRPEPEEADGVEESAS